MEKTAAQIDAGLVKKVLNGQDGAFNMLVQHWQQPIYRFLFRMITHKEEAEDLAQQVFLSAYSNISSLKDPNKFKQWLFTIAVNKARDFIKTKKNNRFYSLGGGKNDENDNDSCDMLESGDDTVAEVQKRELADILKQALEQIPEDQKDVVILKEYQGMTFEEISQILGCSVNTVKSRMYYGLKKLKDILESLSVHVEEYYENV